MQEEKKISAASIVFFAKPALIGFSVVVGGSGGVAARVELGGAGRAAYVRAERECW
jgi:hypothetical protein